jgi:3-phosphoshikimate 1-carboxyvinyltransferase
VSDSAEIQPTGPVRGSVRPPGSKSITNRALICAALAQGRSTLRGALESDDTEVMIDGLRRLGLDVVIDSADCRIEVAGCGGRIPAQEATMFVGNSGTTVRFLTAMLTLGHGRYVLDGTPRMRERPIGDLVDGLNRLGASVRALGPNGCPPVEVLAQGLPGGVADVRGDVSSQFLSGLLMAAPYAMQPVELRVAGQLVSQPYVHMTLAVMNSFGVSVDAGDLSRFTIDNAHGYRGCDYAIEPDASAASYFFGAAAVTGGDVTVEGLSADALQGDVALVDVLERMGCLVERKTGAIRVVGRPLIGVEVDMNPISDTVQTLAAVALFAKGPTTITGVAHIRHKETDRIGAVVTELRKLGAEVEERADGLKITPPVAPESLHGCALDTYDDHRMAMSLSLVGLRVPGVWINDPGCTRKTYPRYFEDLEKLAATGRA